MRLHSAFGAIALSLAVFHPESSRFAASAAEGGSSGSIGGVVVSRLVGTPVPGAVVRLQGASPPRAVTAGDDGTFLFDSLPPGRYVVFPEGGERVSVAGSPVSVDLADGEALDFDLEVLATYRVSGRLSSPGTGRRIAGFRLVLRGESGVVDECVTRPDGAFLSRAVFSPGSVDVEDARGALGLSSPADPTPDRFRLASVTIVDAHATGVGVLMPWTGRAEGRVLDSNGRVVSGAIVVALAGARRHELRLRGSIDERFARRATTGVDGTYSIEHLPADRELEFVAGGTGYASSVSPPVVVHEDGATVVELTLLRAARIEGRVDGPQGEPLPSASVSLSRIGLESLLPNDPTPRPVGPGGEFAFEGLSPGRYFVRVAAPPHVFDAVGPLDLAEGETGHAIARASLGALAISGVVTRSDGETLPASAAVVAMKIDGGPGYPPSRARVDESGRFSVPLRERGRYRLVARTTALESGEPVEAESGDEGIELTWAPARAAVRVRVIDDASGAAIEGADTLAFLPELPESPVMMWRSNSSGEGRRAMALAPGRYEFVAAGRGRAPARVVVEVSPDESGERCVEIRLEPGRSVSGHVVDESGLPAAGVSVAVVAGMTPLATTTVTSGADGRFTVDALPASGGAIAIVRPDGFRASPVDASGGDVRLVFTARPENWPR